MQLQALQVLIEPRVPFIKPPKSDAFKLNPLEIESQDNLIV